jgi:transcriptional regulator with GAF, ATPase, and Fis domain
MASDGDRDGTEALRLQNVVERERAKLRALQDISAALGSTLDLGELLDMILSRISELMEADRSTLYLLDEETDELWSKVVQGDDVREIRLKPGEGLAGAVATSTRPGTGRRGIGRAQPCVCP